MSLQFQEISRGETLWVSSIILRDDNSHTLIYTPAIVKHATHKEVCVRVGNVQPFSTDWLYGFFSPEAYDEDPSAYPTTVRAEGELIFLVEDDEVQPIAKKHALYRTPHTCINPYPRVNFKCDYGDFEPTVNGFVNAAWALEKERMFPRFTKPALRQFVENFFIEDMDGSYMKVRYPQLFDNALVYQERTNSLNYESPSSRQSILGFFFERCVPYLADKNWFDLVRATGLITLNYIDSWRVLHRAYVIADQENVGAMSCVINQSSVVAIQSILDGLGLLDSDINLFSTPKTDEIVLQIKTEVMRDRLARV